jgi:hypothetical protein
VHGIISRGWNNDAPPFPAAWTVEYGRELCPAGEERRRLLGIVAAPIIELGGAGVAMAGGFLHIFELGAVFERRGDEGGAHRVWVDARLSQ